MDGTFELTPTGPFSLAAASDFARGFLPTATGHGDGAVRLVFAVERADWRTAGVALREEDGTVRGRVVAASGEAPDEALVASASAQAVRMLSLDVDGRGFADVGRRDPVVAGLQERFPGLRPVQFPSPYEAAAWAILSQRIRVVQAANVRRQLARDFGQTVEVAGEPLDAFPAPARLAALPAPRRGLTPRKTEQLRSIAHAALDGRLAVERLRRLPEADALRGLMDLPGIGPFGGDLILIRGAGAADRFPEHEPRFRLAMCRAYGLEEGASTEALLRIAEAWRPYRSWVAVLLRVALEEDDPAPVMPAGSAAPPRRDR